MPSIDAATVLAPMPEQAFDAFVRVAVPHYAAEKVAAGQWAAEDAPARAEAAFAQLLPQGWRTPGHWFFLILDGQGVPVGHLWVAREPQGGRDIAYVYDLRIDDAHQRRGHARAALMALEAFARAQGCVGIGLHVFGHNTGARALYDALGFRATSLVLLKPLD